ncbi:MAG: HD domain-containing protein [Candidatus Methanomethylicia archaeon]
MDIVKVVEDKVIKIYLDSKGNYPSSHDLLHVKRVLNNALTIASHMHLSDREIILLRLACLLHDISIPLNGVKEDHAIHSANYASSILIDHGLQAEDIEIICGSIREHSWRFGLKPSNIVSMILQDADRLDALGVIGFARMVTYGEVQHRNLYFDSEPIPKFRCVDENYTLDHTFSKLILLPDSMNTELGKRMAKSRLNILLWLIKIMQLEIEGLI